MADRNTVRATQPLLAGVSKENAKFLFTTAPTVWSPKWVGSTTNYARRVNARLTDGEAAFLYSSGGWDRDLEVPVSQGKYYTFIIGKSSTANNDFSILETSYQPVDILNVAQDNYLVQAGQSVAITVTMSQALSAGEYGFVRYSSDGWTTSSMVSLTSLSAANYTALIPGFTNDTEVSYYAFTSNQASPPVADVDFLTLKINNNGNANYNYTVGYTVTCGTQVGVVTSQPSFPLPDSPLTIFFNAELGNGGLVGYEGDVYIHTGVITNLSTGSTDWKYVKTTWGQNTPDTKLERLGENLYKLEITSIRSYFGVPTAEQILKVALVFRSGLPVSGTNFREGKNADGSDIFVDVYEQQLNVKILSPSKRNALIPANVPLAVCVDAMLNQTITLYLDGVQVFSETTSSVTYPIMPNELSPGTHWLKAKAQNATGQSVFDSVSVYMRGPVVVEALPDGMKPGINYISNTSVTLVLHDPAGLKQFAFVVGDFSTWKPTDQTYMKKTPDGKNFWITLTGLTSGTEYAYQYLIDGTLKIADAYCEKILDPWNDPWIPTTNYPNLKRYPYDLTTGIVSLFQTNQTPYNWAVPTFTPPAINATQQDLVIYELLVRDFVDSKRIKHVTDSLDYFVRLGINAIQLMPIMEFDGNESWGYAPNFFFATDKYYGTKNDYKKFIDECHKRNIAVILDIVPNHAFGQNPMLQMYFNPDAGEHGQPTSNNPWFNQTATHPFSVGYDFNHESPHTRAFFKRFLEFWLTEYKVDGFRFDLSKGLTQNNTGSDIGAWSAYDQSRINILTDYYNHVKSINSNAYVILEHFANNSEETVLANAGMMLWGNMDSQFKQVILGYQNSSDFSWAHHASRGWNYPNCIAFMESHDEDRQMHEATSYGNSSGSYNIRDTTTALQRMEMAKVLMFGVPGPKMMWQFAELGYDYSIMYGGDRTFPKPPRWDYDLQPNRKKLFRITAAMIELQKSDAFRYGTFTHDLSGLGKRMWISHSSMNVVVAANMGVSGFDMAPGFQHSGTWYDYFAGDSISVSDPTGHTINFPPGSYKVYTNVRKPKPFHGFTFTVRNSETQALLKNAIISVQGSSAVATDTTGTAWIPVNAGTLAYSVSRHGYFTATGTIQIPQNQSLEIQLVRDPNVSIDTENLTIDKTKLVYPNPASGILNIDGYKGHTVVVYNMYGQLLSYNEIKNHQHSLDISGLKHGIYFVKLTEKRHSEVVKIVVMD
jgi:1,4-alpha-glucan branching enzyme